MIDQVRLYDTLAREVVQVEPADGRVLTMYTCGPTVYRPAHIGNLRTFLMADLIRRAFEYRGTEVRQIQNITDVGHMTDELTDSGRDRMELAMDVEGKTAKEIADHYTSRFMTDIAAFNLRPAVTYPRASDHIPQMIDVIQRLIANGHAYESNGSVYYDVRSFPAYGVLSGNTLDALKADHRKEIADENKRFHADFVLWVNAGPNRAIRFPSPWGEGYPGWHIECTAMSFEHLGEGFDLHTGGEDNVFPHHEGEIAQSDGATGHRTVRHWVHGAHLLSEGRKMAKSARNFYELSDLAPADPLAARLLFLQSRYRAQMNFTREGLSAADTALRRWRRSIEDWSGAPKGGATDTYEARFVAAMSEDLDTPAAVKLVPAVIGATDLEPGTKRDLLLKWDAFLGLDLGRSSAVEVPAEVLEMLDRRQAARAARDFAASDAIRDAIMAAGFDIDDTPTGPVARPRP